MTDTDPKGEDGPSGADPDPAREGLTYAESGVDIDESEAATEALIGATEGFEGDFAGLVDIGERYLALATDGVGTKLLVAEALDDYSTVGIDCIAMNVNDLVAAGIEPVAFVDYLAVEEPDPMTNEQIGEGLAIGAELADVALVGGETAVMPDVIDGLDIAGTAAGLGPKDGLFPGEAEVGDAIVGWPSSGIHSNGLTLAREAVTREGEYTDPFPPTPSKTIGEELLEPTRIYTDLLDPLREHGAHAAAHVTGGGWTNLTRMGPYRYVIEEPFDAPPIFEFVREAGDIDDAEMHRTFNMGTGFVAALDPDDAMSVVESTADGRIVGRVADGSDGVSISGLELS
ncbi:phosphoribosylformylglycinamidine cyclo-ligase [Halorhabdus amylolytica]|uniref:phosphoribosylformylglycinamidine cyclo-ligase n=1 Tax=Halorhabdus amylolytica TaxID=2559573 RepID=UPI0010AAD90F|nr:phosphoribosylformylglycinamidine cyclo-ligase [Halorhabdus amylolytica]